MQISLHYFKLTMETAQECDSRFIALVFPNYNHLLIRIKIMGGKMAIRNDLDLNDKTSRMDHRGQNNIEVFTCLY